MIAIYRIYNRRKTPKIFFASSENEAIQFARKASHLIKTTDVDITDATQEFLDPDHPNHRATVKALVSKASGHAEIRYQNGKPIAWLIAKIPYQNY